jgi:uncharacterized protein (TIGR03067 family)
MKGAVMRIMCFCLLLSLVAVAPLIGQQEKAKKDIDVIQGTWLVEALEYNGTEFKDKFKLSFMIKGDVMTVEGDGEVKKEYAKLTLKLDSATSPKCIDMKVTDGVQMDVTMEGIYELKNDELRLCVKVFGQDRPGEFKSPDGSSIALLKLKRQKN